MRSRTSESRQEAATGRSSPSSTRGSSGSESGTISRAIAPARPRFSAGPGLHVIYAISGATALLYENAWTRLLSLELGHTTASAAAVLAAFMGGLAAGALLIGRLTPRLTPAAALKLYAGLELAIAACALAVPIELSAAHPLLAIAYGEGPGGFFFHAARLFTALLIVGLPATLMGATYPLVIVEGRAAGSLYAANTAGAAVGVLATGFFLLPRLGLFQSILAGVAGNVLVALVAWWLSARYAAPGARRESRESPAAARAFQTPPSPPEYAAPRTEYRFALLATAIAGYAALSLEIAWTRTLAMVMGPTTYAFSTTVACFIIGLALGSGAASWLIRRNLQAEPPGGTVRGNRPSDPAGDLRPTAWLGLALAASALSIAWAMRGVDDFVLAVARRTVQPDVTYGRLLVSEFFGAATLLLPVAFCSGAAFPLAIAAARAWSGRQAARVYGANTAGAIAGALVTAGLTIPVAGLRGTFLIAAGLLSAMSALFAVTQLRSARILPTASALAVIATGAVLGTTGWNVQLLSSGAYKYSAYVGEPDLEPRLTAGTLNFYREGATGTVAVRDLAGVRTLSIDGKVDASNGGDMLTQRLLAHVPLMLHPNAERVAIIGLGSGVTLGAALTHRITQADVIEISPEVIEASAWFADENRHALQDRRVRLIRGDARTHFRLAAARYDAVISEPSNPWMAGVASLFTREFFEALRDRLAPGGVVCQWAHSYDIAADDLRSIIGTFASVFPHVTAFLVGDGDLLLVGSENTLTANIGTRAVSEDARRDLQLAGVTDLRVLDQFRLGDAQAIRSWTGTPVFQSDDRMALEFTGPASTIGASRDDNASALLRFAARPSSDPLVLRDAGLLALGAQAPERAWEWLNTAASGLPEDPATLRGLVRAAAMSGKPDRLATVESRLRGVIDERPNALAPRLELARMLASRGEYDRARRVALDAQGLAPGNAEVQEELASIAADAADAPALDEALVRLRIERANAASTSYFEAVLCMITGHPAAAIPFARAAVAASPRHAAAWNLLGSALASTGAPADEIRNALRRSIRADPSDPAAYANLGTFELSSGRPALAANWFAQALTVDPTNDAARNGLAAAHALVQ